jgi:hypothetical protein
MVKIYLKNKCAAGKICCEKTAPEAKFIKENTQQARFF